MSPAIKPADVTMEQYQLIAARKVFHDTMLWQTPVISLTALAFLFTIALGDGPRTSRIVTSFLALFAAVASAQLLARHRHFQQHYSKLLQDIERAKGLPVVHQAPPSGKFLARWSSYNIWFAVFIAFGAVALWIGAAAIGEPPQSN